MTLKVLGGELKGRTLDAPPSGLAIRPTSARRREAVFDILRGRLSDFRELRFADLFAGTGAVAIEALSQGFGHAVLVEQDRTALSLIRRNLELVELNERAQVLPVDAARLPAPAMPVDVAFLDPPYGQGLAAAALRSLVDGGWLTPATVVLAEIGRSERLEPPDGLAIAREHLHGAGRLVRLAVA